jgi:asparagine synthase (glutamine-hydrolysing)
MCGIVGFIGKNADSKGKLIQGMLDKINHRGPNSSKIVIYDDCIFGFNRLSINDLSENGMQPFETNDYIVFANGEIYNHKDLRKKYKLDDDLNSNSDIELVPHLFKKLGFGFLNELNGAFAIALFVKKTGKLHLILDRLGKKPMYYYETIEGVYFASELKSFLLNFDLKLDLEAINWGFFQGYFPYPMTPVKGIKKVRPSEILTISKDLSVSSDNWYTFKPDYETPKLNEIEMQEKFLTLLDDAVDIRMEADVEAGLYLSGGLDSTSIAMSCAHIGYQNIHTFTGKVQSKEYSTDNINASRFAKEYSFNHHVIEIDVNTYRNNIVETSTAFDEINFESANINFIEIVREASKHVTIMLDGCGGDEVFFGYGHQRSLYRLPKVMRNMFPEMPAIKKYFAKHNSKMFSYYIGLTDVEKFFCLHQAFIPIDEAMQLKHFNLEAGHENLKKIMQSTPHSFKDKRDLNYLSYMDILGLDMLNYQELDRCSMYHSVEPRSPFSDYRIWETFMGVGEKQKLDTGGKALMRRLLSKRLPSYILEAKKDGFSNPFYLWFLNDNEFRSEILSLIGKRKELLYDVLGAVYVDKLLSKWSHLTNLKWMDGILLNQLVAFVIWHIIYFERKDLYKMNLSLSELNSLL